MRAPIRLLRQRLLVEYSRYESRMLRDTPPRSATCSFCRRACSLDQAIWLLLEHEAIPEAAILLRSQLNLSWCFLFMVDAQSRNGRYEFDHEPTSDSNFGRRAARFLSWHWVELHRMEPTPRTQEMLDQFIRENGYRNPSEVPRYWYQEDRIQSIKALARTVGSLRQYEEDYTHLSGIEHTDITASLVQNLCGPRYGDFVAFKSTQIVSAILDFAIRICGCTLNDQWGAIIGAFNRMSDEIAIVARRSNSDGA